MSISVTVRQKVNIPMFDKTVTGTFISFNGLASSLEHFAIKLGPDNPLATPLVRLHSECITGDLFHSRRCDCGKQLREALEAVTEEGGYIIYMRQEGRGIGLFAKLDAYTLQDTGLDTFEANRRLGFPDDARDFSEAADMLRALGASRIRLLTNNPEKIEELRRNGIDVIEARRTGVFVNKHNIEYLSAKARIGHHDIALKVHTTH
jgi:GTP cyclohydrolase II